MASRVEPFDILIPAGTTIAAPQITVTRFDPGDVERVEVRIPPGPSGLVGFGILYSGVSVIPREPTKWIVADDEPINWPLESQPDAGAWGVRAYNIDVFDHTLYFRFLVREHERTAARPIARITINQSDQLAPVPEPGLTPEVV